MLSQKTKFEITESVEKLRVSYHHINAFLLSFRDSLAYIEETFHTFTSKNPDVNFEDIVKKYQKVISDYKVFRQSFLDLAYTLDCLRKK